jgi:hypothetical protein
MVWHRRPRGGLAGMVGIDNVAIQFLIFVAVSSGLTAASRTIFVNYFSREKTGNSLRSGADSLPERLARWYRRVVVRLTKAQSKYLVQRGLHILRPGSRLLKQVSAFVSRASRALQFTLGELTSERAGSRNLWKSNCRPALRGQPHFFQDVTRGGYRGHPYNYAYERGGRVATPFYRR